MSTVGNRQEMIACQILPQTVHRVIQRCCTAADCDNTSNPEFHSEPPATKGREIFTCVLVMLAVKQLGS